MSNDKSIFVSESQINFEAFESKKQREIDELRKKTQQPPPDRTGDALTLIHRSLEHIAYTVHESVLRIEGMIKELIGTMQAQRSAGMWETLKGYDIFSPVAGVYIMQTLLREAGIMQFASEAEAQLYNFRHVDDEAKYIYQDRFIFPLMEIKNMMERVYSEKNKAYLLVRFKLWNKNTVDVYAGENTETLTLEMQFQPV